MAVELFEGYEGFFQKLKQRVQHAQLRAALAVNQEALSLYWQIGHDIVEAQERHQWGDKVLERIAADLKRTFPNSQGYSRANLYRMRSFFLAYPDENTIVAQAVRQIPWGHNVLLLQRVKDPEQRLWYAQQVSIQGWTRPDLEKNIKNALYDRQGKAITNFSELLPAQSAQLAQQLLKDPYNFDFLGLSDDALEREIETGLLTHLKDFMLELGVGFAFLGNQYELEVGGDNFYIDLLFYHVKLHCYVVIELKARAFKPEDTGQMSFYLSAVDGILRGPEDKPTIGLLLCKSKNQVVAEYALRGIQQPLGVSEYQLVEALPKDLEASLPTVAQLEEELARLEVGDE